MTNQVQILRSRYPGNRPTGRLPGELFWNEADNAFGVVAFDGAPYDIIAGAPVIVGNPAASLQTINSDLSVSGQISADSFGAVGDIDVGGNVNVTGMVDVTGTASFGDDVSASGDVKSSKSLEVVSTEERQLKMTSTDDGNISVRFLYADGRSRATISDFDDLNTFVIRRFDPTGAIAVGLTIDSELDDVSVYLGSPDLQQAGSIVTRLRGDARYVERFSNTTIGKSGEGVTLTVNDKLRGISDNEPLTLDFCDIDGGVYA